MKKIISIISLVFVGIAFALLIYSGLFAKIEVVEKEVGPFVIAYVDHTGPYTGVMEDMDKVYQELIDLGVNPTLGAGIYLDDPELVKPEQLRSQVGSIIPDSDLDKLEQIKQKLFVREIPAQQAFVIEFPTRTPVSYVLAPMKVYPAIGKYIEDRGIPSPEFGLEIYDVPGKKSIYVMPLMTDANQVKTQMMEMEQARDLMRAELSDHQLYVLTLELDDGDPAPAEHILEGYFKI